MGVWTSTSISAPSKILFLLSYSLKSFASSDSNLQHRIPFLQVLKVDQPRKVAKRTVMSHSRNRRLQITTTLTPCNIDQAPALGLGAQLKAAFVTETPETMKAEKLEAVLISSLHCDYCQSRDE
ncbi:hypothetical protein CRG98_008824 [Punica granatum]|uniref:Uncharacterized protein n=1 Tax=Punica granatum TaxID=22663 RepID=A0A2I0KQM7_PUNGR|nr:hypothetical protein CRG98_008824 [Punica granatum]